MHINRIKLKNFRNYASLDLGLEKGVNILQGNNAQGKTNLLEAVYLCCVGKSLRGRDRDLIKQGQGGCRVYVEAERDYGKFTVEIYISENKRILVNGIPILRTGELLGGINSVYFSPDELKLIKDAPQCRRKFLDIDISQVNKKYFLTLSDYSRVLMQRNNILKNRDKQVFSMLEIYNSQLAAFGSYITKERKNFLDSITAEAAKIHKHITKTEKLGLTYQSSLKSGGTDIGLYEKELNASLEKDLNFGYTSLGPHRDDIKITSDAVDVRVYGSQGQQRTCALSLKLSELKYFKEISGEYPVLLLDDVLSELDASRKERLLEYCQTVQTVLTTADPAENFRVPGAQIFTVEKGEITKTNNFQG